MMTQVPMVTVVEVLNSAVFVAWISALAAVATWLTKTRADRRVRVRATAGIGWTHDSVSGAPTDHFVDFVVFNNLPLPVGIHSVTVELDRPERQYFGPSLVNPPPTSLEAQHSARITYTADQLRRLWGGLPTSEEEAGKRRYKIRVALGNGSHASSKWFMLPVEVEMKPFEGDQRGG
jgi:hypothetical protein